MSEILAALECEPRFFDELPLPYGPVKHPDHEYAEQILRSIGYIQEADFNWDLDAQSSPHFEQ